MATTDQSIVHAVVDGPGGSGTVTTSSVTLAANGQSFVRSVLSGPDGSGSTARLCTFLVVIFPLLWVTYLVLRLRVVPDLTGITEFIVAVAGSLYGVNKVAAAVTAIKTKPTGENT